MINRFVLSLFCIFAAAATPAFAVDPILNRADEFMAQIHSGQFDEAAKSFHYPESYTPAELEDDRKAVAAHLRSLFREIGDIEAMGRVSTPAGQFVFLSEMGGNLPYWEQHPTHNRDVTYRAVVKHDGEVYFVVSLINPAMSWELRLFTLQISASRPNATKRMSEIASKVYGNFLTAPPKAPNPSVNADAPTHAFDSAGTVAGAPFTLFR